MTILRFVLVLASIAVISSACGSDPKKEPVAATSPASAEPAAPATPAVSAAPAAPEGAKPDTKEADCTSIQEDASSSLDAKRIEFAEKSCKKDADCVAIQGHACSFNCVNGAIPKSEEKAWNDALAKVKDGACKKWTDNDCAKLRTKPQPACQDRKVTCDKGKCALK